MRQVLSKCVVLLIFALCVLALSSCAEEEIHDRELGYGIVESTSLDLDGSRIESAILIDSILYFVATDQTNSYQSVMSFSVEDQSHGKTLLTVETHWADEEESMVFTTINGLARSGDNLWVSLINRVLDENGWPSSYSTTIKEISLQGELLDTIIVDDSLSSALPHDALSWAEFDFAFINNEIILNYRFFTHTMTLILSADGELIEQVESDVHVLASTTTENGAIIVMTEDAILQFNMESRRWEAKESLPRSFFRIAGGNLIFDYFLWDDSSFYGLSESEAVSLFNWLGFAYDSSEISNIFPFGDSLLFVTVGGSILTVEQTAHNPVRLRLGTWNRDARIIQRVQEFNRSQAGVVIEVVDYSQYSTDRDVLAGSRRLQVELMSGSGPDIIDTRVLPGNIAIHNRSGLFADIFPFLDADTVLSRDALVQEVLSTLTYSGRLYQVIPSFSIATYVGTTELIAMLSEFTFSELLDATLAGDEVAQYFLSMTRAQFLQHFLHNHMDRFIDWETGMADFDSDEFIQILEVAMSLPEQAVVTDSVMEGSHGEMAAPIDDRSLAFRSVGIGSFHMVQVHEFLFGSDFLYWDLDESSRFVYDFPFSISSSSDHKEEAWLFLREFFLPADSERDIRRGSRYAIEGFSINQETFERQKREAQTPNTWIDEDGDEHILYNQIHWLPDGQPLELYAVTDSEISRLLDVLENVTRAEANDFFLLAMIWEDIMPFLYGAQTAAETARIIQSRVQIYISELT